jgi:hypothetical protein
MSTFSHYNEDKRGLEHALKPNEDCVKAAEPGIEGEDS